MSTLLLATKFAMLKSKTAYDEQKFVERKNASEQKRVKRMVSELTRLGYAVSLAA
jgi:hypothetical protein